MTRIPSEATIIASLPKERNSVTSDRFAPLRAFVVDLERICSGGDDDAAVAGSVKSRLSELIAGRPALPEQTRRTAGECYGRHLLYGDPLGAFEVVVMTWGPGQGTPVHDHGGIWCVEGVIEGVVDVTRYDLVQMVGAGRARMESIEVIHAGLGECGALIPPVEYHRIANPYDKPAITVHVYGGRMRTCRVFDEEESGVYRVAEKQLRFTTHLDAFASTVQ